VPVLYYMAKRFEGVRHETVAAPVEVAP
jgi:hypothetical protein